jgi:hypothetical protein
MRFNPALWLVVLAALCGCGDSAAPSVGPGRNVVHGKVLGGLMRAVADVDVTVTLSSWQWRTRTDAYGLFALDALPDGIAMLTATKGGDTARMVIDLGAPRPIGYVVRLPRFSLAWSDEFDGPTLDRASWFAWRSPSANEGERGRYLPEQVTVENGLLRIRSDAQRPGELWHPTGAVVSRYHQRYGRFEIRARLPRSQGHWPAHWLTNADSVAPIIEIDIMEMLGDDPSTLYFHNHWETSTGFTSGRGGSYSGPVDYSADFHTFRVDWYVGAIIWYVDGVERYRTSTMVPDRSAILRISSQVGGNWPGPPDASTIFPQFHDVDWVRIYALQQ